MHRVQRKLEAYATASEQYSAAKSALRTWAAIDRVDPSPHNDPTHSTGKDGTVIPRPLLASLVFALPLLVVAFAVVLGGAALAQATLDLVGAQVLRWIAMSVLMLAVVDLILLVGVLGIHALADPKDRSDG